MEKRFTPSEIALRSFGDEILRQAIPIAARKTIIVVSAALEGGISAAQAIIDQPENLPSKKDIAKRVVYGALRGGWISMLPPTTKELPPRS